LLVVTTPTKAKSFLNLTGAFFYPSITYCNIIEDINIVITIGMSVMRTFDETFKF